MKKTRRVNGSQVTRTRVFREGDYYRWKIWTENGREYMDGGNYLSEQQARDGIKDAYDNEEDKTLGHFVTFSKNDDRIYGVGKTASQALADAKRWLDPDTKSTDLETVPATERLVKSVAELGGNIAYEVKNGVADVERGGK